MSIEQIRRDMLYLAGELPHRAALSELEQRAAHYLRDRFRQSTPDVEVDYFHTLDNPCLLFASYYGEFFIVALCAVWWPRLALVYGAMVFLLYLAEFMGYRLLSRLMPRFRSQNVAARFLAEKPKYLFIVTAHYDSGREVPLTRPDTLPMLRPMHFGVLACMLCVVATCAVEALGLAGPASPFPLYLRWAAVGALLSAAVTLFFSSANTEETRGANTNGSGVCALLRLAERFREQPLPNADLWLVATGAHASWMSGTRHLIATHEFERRHTYLLNIESVGAGNLHYLTREGMLQAANASPGMVRAAEETGGPFQVQPAELRAVPTAAALPLARGMHALTVAGLDEAGLPVNWNLRSDTLSEVDEGAIATAAEFCEALLRRLAANLP